MGTRNLICVYYKGRFVIAQYSRWDGYPEGQGWRIAQFLLQKENVEALKAGLCYVQAIDANDDGPEDEVRLDYGKTPSLNPNTGAKILDIVAHATGRDQIRIFKDLDFINNSLYCEWAYVVDLDESVLEVYSGGWAAMKPGVSRFAETGGEHLMLQQTFSISGLPHTIEEFSRMCKTEIAADDSV